MDLEFLDEIFQKTVEIILNAVCPTRLINTIYAVNIEITPLYKNINVVAGLLQFKALTKVTTITTIAQ